MESGSAASTTSAFHATEGPSKRPSSERHSGDHSRKQSINGVQDAARTSSATATDLPLMAVDQVISNRRHCHSNRRLLPEVVGAEAAVAMATRYRDEIRRLHPAVPLEIATIEDLVVIRSLAIAVATIGTKGVPRPNTSLTDVAVRVLGVDTAYMKVRDAQSWMIRPRHPTCIRKDWYARRISNEYELSRREISLSCSPQRGYSFFTDKKFPVFDEIKQASKVIKQIEDSDENMSITAGGVSAANQDHVFTSYLIRNVRRIDERTSHVWMCELASGKKSIQELVQSYGVPFKQWRPVPNVSKCPLLEYVVRYRPGFAEATWFIRLNVIYTEMNEIKRDCAYRLGDWFYNPRRLQRRSQGWTDQLIDYLHSVARQASKTMKKMEAEAKPLSMTTQNVPTESSGNSGKTVILNHRHGDTGMAASLAIASAAPGSAASSSIASPQLSFHEKWSYVLKLSEYQYQLGLLDRFRYFDGLISLLQKALSPRSHSAGNCTSVLSIGVNETMELLTVIHKLLPELLQSSDSIVLLAKSVIQHLRYLLPPGTKIPDDLGSSLQEELVIALCQLLRDILLNGYDILVRMEENGESEIVKSEYSYPSAFNFATMRNEAQVLQTLDRFHRTDASIDLQRVYNEIFVPLPLEGSSLPVDLAAIFLICEWAVTNQRPAEYRYLSALSLFEMHSNALLAYGHEYELLALKKLLKNCEPSDHQVVLQGALQSFLQRYEPKAITEVTQLIDLFCLLVRRRLFSVESFVEFASCYSEIGDHNILSAVNSATKESAGSSSNVVYNIECSPGRGYKSNDIHLLSTTDRLKLYLWQLPRGPFPLPTSIPMVPSEQYDSELNLIRWLEVMELRREHLSYSKTLERAQSLCVYVFHTHGQANDPIDPNAANNRVAKEVEYQGKVGELVSAVKIMCGHDKGRFALWFLRQIYEEPTFFRFSDFGSVEHIVRLVCLILEIVDILALLEVIVYFLRNSPVFLVKNVVIAMIERHEIAYCATGQIPFLLQAFVDRFHRIPKTADDKAGSLAKFFCKMYYAHAKKKEIGKLDLPFALLRPIAETARKNQDANSQKPKELSLDAANPIVRIPPPREVIPPELKSALARSFKALQAKLFESGMSTDKPAVNTPTPLQSPDSSQNSTSVPEVVFEPPPYSSLSWREIVGESTPESETKSRDAAVDFAASAINMSMASASVGSTNANATRERRTPNYVFFLRAVLSEVMDKWMANITTRIKSNCRRPIMTPHYMHRCVRLIREVVEQHPDGDDFQEKFSNTLVVWLQKEVLPGFCGSETQKRTRNPFINLENGKEAFLLNQKGRLDKVQYGLKAFLISLIIHKVLDLSQVLRLVLVPLFPRLRRASRDPPPNLPSQLLAMALVFQLFSEPPQNVLMEPQKLVMFDEPLTKYHLRFMRTQVPACLMFPLVHLLCQISYQMEDNFLLRKREERGTLASITLFNLTSDGIVRDIIFHDTKEAREKHILPVYHKKQWHTAVLLTHFFRPPNSPAEDANGQVQLLKVDQIIDQMNVWVLNRGGSIYLDLQMSRQQLKVKRTKKTSSRQLKRKAQHDISTRPAKRQHSDSVTGEHETLSRANGQQDSNSSDDEEIDLEFDESSSATEILSNLIVLRTLKQSSRPAFLSSSSTLCSVSPIATPQLRAVERPNHGAQGKRKVTLTDAELWMISAAREAQEAAVASLYAATVCSISRRAMGSVIAKILQVMEDDAKYTQQDKFARKINGTTVVRLICGIMCTPPGNAFLPRYMMSLAVQLEWLYDGCCQYDQNPQSFSLAFLERLRRKLAIRLQLVAVIGQSKHVALTICYRDRIAKTLFSLLGTSTVSSGVGLSLFSWILDLIPLVNASVLQEKEFELVESLNLPEELKSRVWTVFPRSAFGSQPVHVRSVKQGEYSPLDPWGLLEHVPQLPSDSLVPASTERVPRKRRVFRCV
ncbi:hypothetical protein FI667_g2199, partial [Globisporangium splendens]